MQLNYIFHYLWINRFGTNVPFYKKAIGEDIKTVQFGWPLGMPLVEKIEPYLWEVRTEVPNGIARILFTVEGHMMILLHGFIKKTKKIPQRELNTARSRLRQYQEAGP